MKIKLNKTHSLYTLFFLQRVDSTNIFNSRSDETEVWVGDDDSDFSPSFTKVISAIYGSGFKQIETMKSG